MARSSVVFPPPDVPSSATTSPLLSRKETPLSTSASPRRLWTFETINSLMEPDPQPQSDRNAQPDQHHLEHGGVPQALLGVGGEQLAHGAGPPAAERPQGPARPAPR